MKSDAHIVHFPHSTLAIDHPLSPATSRRVLPPFHEQPQAIPKLRIEIIGGWLRRKQQAGECGKRLVKFLAIKGSGLDEVIVKV